jgi:hypothetical protein
MAVRFGARRGAPCSGRHRSTSGAWKPDEEMPDARPGRALLVP